MSWQKHRLDEFCKIKHGYAFKSKHFGEDGRYIVLTPGNFYDEGGFKSRGDKEKFYTIDPPEDYILQKDDLIIAMTEQAEGLLGSSALVPEDDRYLHNQRLGLVTELNEQGLDKKFFYYLLNTYGVRGQIRASATGVKVKHTAPKRILNVEVCLPPLDTQRRIAGILSAYDDLIATNNRRMALLEESIQRLYREWFVHLRFPGHERAKVVEDVPEGWEKTTIENAFDILGGGTPRRKESRYWTDGTINWYSPSDLTKTRTMFMESSSDKINEVGLSNSSARLFPPFSVMMTSRATIGVIAINTTEACTNQGFITCFPNERLPLYFLYCWLSANVNVFINLATGATFKEISKGVFKKIPILIPSSRLTQEFQDFAQPIGSVKSLGHAIGAFCPVFASDKPRFGSFTKQIARFSPLYVPSVLRLRQ